MIISHSKKFIFLHVPKAAGTSLFTILGKYKSVDALNSKANMHIRAKDIKELLASDIFRHYFKFGFVRNPWDWLVSHYYYILSRKDHHLYQRVSSIKNFNSFLRWRIHRKKKLQRDYLYDESGNLLVNFVGKYENLEQDFKKVCDILSIPYTRLPHKNRSNHRYYKQYYNSETKKLVYRAYKADIDIFDYKF